MHQCEAEGVGFKLVPDMFELSLGRVQVDDIGGIPIFNVREQQLRRLKLATKQVVDWVLAAVLAVVLVPVMLLTAIAIRLDSRGPILRPGACGPGRKRVRLLQVPVHDGWG